MTSGTKWSWQLGGPSVAVKPIEAQSVGKSYN